MSDTLSKARADMQRALIDVELARQAYRNSVQRFKEQELRVQKLEITLMEWEIEQAVLRKRKAAGQR